MKREYSEDNPNSDTNNNNNNNIMFPKLPHIHHHHPTTSDETDSHPPQPPQDGATIEVVRRPRGRPPGSKNKPKPPLIIHNHNNSSDLPHMSPYVLELPPGADIVASTTHFCRKRNVGLCVLNGHGVVSNVTLRQPSTATNHPPGVITFHGRFELLSISATISEALSSVGPSFAISLAGPQGQVVGGLVLGPLLAAGTVYLIAATFNSPSFHRLQSPHQDEDDDAHEEEPGSGGGDAPDQFHNNYQQQQQHSDVVWAPTARPPPPPPNY